MVLEACAAEGGTADDDDGRGGVRPGDGYASVLATAVNQDGKSASFMAPNGPSQEALLREAMAEAGLRWAGQAGEHGAGLGYVESHGTGTALGDPMEVGALGRVLAGGGAANHRGEQILSGPGLMLGALKSSMGTPRVGGVMGMIKTVGTLSGAAPPTCTCGAQRQAAAGWVRGGDAGCGGRDDCDRRCRPPIFTRSGIWPRQAERSRDWGGELVWGDGDQRTRGAGGGSR